MTQLPFFARIESHGDAVALRRGSETFTYRELAERSRGVASALLGDRDDLREARVALLLPPGAEFVAALWAVWRGGGVVLPLCLSAAEAEWEYALTDSGAEVVVATRELGERIGPTCQRLGRRIVELPPTPNPSPPKRGRGE